MSKYVEVDKVCKFIKSEINPYGKPFEGSVYDFGMRIIKYLENVCAEEKSVRDGKV